MCKIIPACLNFRGLAPASLSNQPHPAKWAIFAKIGGKTRKSEVIILHHSVHRIYVLFVCWKSLRECFPDIASFHHTSMVPCIQKATEKKYYRFETRDSWFWLCPSVKDRMPSDFLEVSTGNTVNWERGFVKFYRQTALSANLHRFLKEAFLPN